jgi:iron-sulfur cluster repair protein YtfE (RIC family)
MKITQALYGEHGVFYSLFREIRRFADESDDVAELRGAATLLGRVLASHASLEDEVLFPAIDAGGPVGVMRVEHDQIDRLAEGLAVTQDLGELRHRLVELLDFTEAHFAKEEQVLFPMSEARLPPEELERLGGQWAALRGVEI